MLANSSTASPSDHAGSGEIEWEERYRTGDMPWEKGAPHPALAQWLDEHPISGRVLVPGCGFGHDVRLFAAAGTEVVGLDIASRAIAGARTFKPAGSERYVLANLFDLPSEFRGSFDWVVEHTCFCAIHPSRRLDYVTAVASALHDGGHLIAVYYLDPDNKEPGPPYGVTIEELAMLFNPRFEVLSESVPTRTFEGRENRELLRLLRRIR